MKVLDKGILRHGQELFDEEGNLKLGTITIGTFSPRLKEGIALALVNKACSETGTIVTVKVREKVVHATIVQKPLYAYHPRN